MKAMGSRFVSAVAFYGPKAGRLRELLTGVQALIAEHVGGDFRPYTLEQVHATLIALNGVRAGGTIVNEYLLEHAGERREMDLPRVMDILARRFATPLRVRIGGVRPGQPVPLTSRGPHFAEPSVSLPGHAVVLVGWSAGRLAERGGPTGGRAAPGEDRGRGAAPLSREAGRRGQRPAPGGGAPGRGPSRRIGPGYRRGPGQAGRRPGGPGHRPVRRHDR